MADVRDLVLSALDDPSFTDLLPLDRLYEDSSVPDPIAGTPYGVFHYGIVTPNVMNILDLDFWIHDAPGTYVNLTRILKAAHPLLLAARGQTDSGWLSAVRWEGESTDLWDDATKTIARYRTYRLVGTGV